MSGFVGIDVAKDELVVYLMWESGGRSEECVVKNDKSGFKTLMNWLKKRTGKEAHVCLEATGIYGDAITEALHEKGYRVSVVNPARISAYAQSQMRRNKTDGLDAELIADYCRTQNPMLWTPPTPAVKELRQLVRHLANLKQEKVRAENRRSVEQHTAIIEQLTAQIDLLVQQIEEIKQAIKDLIKRDPTLRKEVELLESIPGIGILTAAVILSELGDIHRFDDVRQVVAFVGLNPRQSQSGRKRTSVGISRMGRSSLRAALYLPAVVAKNCNPILSVFAKRMLSNGLTPMQTVVAVMRKLLHLVYGILKSGRPFDPNYLSSTPLPS